MFDVGFQELFLLGVIALLVVGPDRLPGLVRTVGMWIGRAQRIVGKVRTDIERELHAEEIRRAMRENSPVPDLMGMGDELKKTVEPSPLTATAPPTSTASQEEEATAATEPSPSPADATAMAEEGDEDATPTTAHANGAEPESPTPTDTDAPPGEFALTAPAPAEETDAAGEETAGGDLAGTSPVSDDAERDERTGAA